MCCDDWDYGPAVSNCPDCGEPVNEDGEAVTGCKWSPTDCETCGSRPCDGLC